ncbi:MAG: carboxypeptidase regulatory-like domain-containing protein [Verrucomicrobia bacterium]|nr:carboxypeptidase regulatory-like domain-containing protein [Verrucomicrobiota bacterium]
MKPFTTLLLAATLAHADTVIDGHVELPKTKVTPVMAKRYEIVTKGGVLSTNPPAAVVYLEGSFDQPATQPVRQIIQKDLVFNPSLLAVQTGTKVEFPNQDDTYHNVFSFSPAKRFDLGRHRPEDRPVPSQVFDKAGMITLRCDIHEHMRGIILVLDTPHFVISGTDGNFKLGGLPAGTYKLKVWLDSRTTLEKSVTLTSGSTTKLSFP